MNNAIDLTFGLTDEEITERFTKAVELANEKKKAMGVPLPKYNTETKEAYLEYSDGRKEKVCRSENQR